VPPPKIQGVLEKVKVHGTARRVNGPRTELLIFADLRGDDLVKELVHTPSLSLLGIPPRIGIPTGDNLSESNQNTKDYLQMQRYRAAYLADLSSNL